jgi:hypothetical protein
MLFSPSFAESSRVADEFCYMFRNFSYFGIAETQPNPNHPNPISLVEYDWKAKTKKILVKISQGFSEAKT